MHLFLLLLTPILLLVIVALLGFVGCDKLLGFDTIHVQPAAAHVQTIVQTGPAGKNSMPAVNLSALTGGELIIATVQWKGSLAGPQMPAFTPALPNKVGEYVWQGIDIQVFWGTNPDGNTQFSVQLPQNSTIPWNLCITAYGNTDPNTPTYSPQTSALNYVGNNPQTPAIGLAAGDILYAVGFAADSTGAFPGSATNVLTPGPGFTAEFPTITNPLVEDLSGSQPTVAQVTNTTTDANPKGFVFGLGIKAKPTG